MLNILPRELYAKISARFSAEKIYEMRLRTGKRIMINYAGEYMQLGEVCRTEYIEEIILRASGHSLYSVNEQLKNGYIAAPGGIRIGVCGEASIDAGTINTIRNISSLNIRVPHEVKGCADSVTRRCFNKGLSNVLIISPPGAGKTTLIRDLCRVASAMFPQINILVIDERGEISGQNSGGVHFDLGSSDVMLGFSKSFGFSSGIRSMRPDLIVCDELKGDEDYGALYEAMSCGVNVVATLHASGLDDIYLKNNFGAILASRYFDYYVVLSHKPSTGTVTGIFDKDFTNLGSGRGA